MTFAERLRMLMDDKDINAHKIFKATGISQSTIKNYLDGGEPTKSKIKQLSVFFGVNDDWLLSGNGDKDREIGGILGALNRFSEKQVYKRGEARAKKRLFLDGLLDKEGLNIQVLEFLETQTDIINMQEAQIKEKDKQLAEKDKQIEKLLSLLEKK